MKYRVITGDCLDILPTLDADSIDAVVTDPPYGLSFMGKAWDKGVPSVEVWREVLRVLKPGGHLLAFAGTRTQHRMASAIDDAGFEIRDMIAWVYGSGFPKSLDVSKAIDKAAGAEREVIGKARRTGKEPGTYGAMADNNILTTPATPEAQQWDGWGTALKPALEPITVARNPLTGTVAANVLEYGTGAINVDGCRVGTESTTTVRNGNSGAHGRYGKDERVFTRTNPPGRWPANLIHDGSDEVVRLFPVTKDASAARFFYCAKASKRDRDEGLDHLPKTSGGMVSNTSGQHMTRGDDNYEVSPRANNHPTVKPTDLMRYLVRLVTPPGGTVLDPYTGSGSTGKACAYDGFDFVGIELDPEYVEIAKARIQYAIDNPETPPDAQPELFDMEPAE